MSVRDVCLLAIGLSVGGAVSAQGQSTPRSTLQSQPPPPIGAAVTPGPEAGKPPPGVRAGPASPPVRQGAGKILLVDDDESDNNNNPGDGRLSKSDLFYRHLLEGKSLVYDAFVVPRYASGPTLEQLRPYRLILWYTGASYGGNRDNTSVVSLKDEETLRRYLTETGGSVIVFSPGYMNNAIGAGGTAMWSKKESRFLQEVLGIQGGRGLLQRFKGGTVAAADGTRYSVTANASVEAQFSTVNPGRAKVLFTAQLDPDGTGARPVPVATSNAVGAGQMVYVGFTFENVAGDAEAAFGQLLQVAGAEAATVSTVAPPATSVQPGYPKRMQTEAMTATGIGRLTEGPPFVPKRALTEAMTVTGIGQLTEGPPFVAKRVRTEGLTVTGTGSIQ